MSYPNHFILWLTWQVSPKLMEAYFHENQGKERAIINKITISAFKSTRSTFFPSPRLILKLQDKERAELSKFEIDLQNPPFFLAA